MHNWSEELFAAFILHLPDTYSAGWKVQWPDPAAGCGDFRLLVPGTDMGDKSRLKLKSIINKCTRQEIFVQFKCLSLRPYAIWVIKCTTFSQLSIFCMWNVETQTQQTHTNIYYLSTHTKNVMIKYEMLSCLKLSFLLSTKKLLINHSNRKYNIANICFIWLYICFVYC